MIVPELLLLEIERKANRRDAVMFDQPFLGITPEAFHAVNVHSTTREASPVIDFQMPIPTEHQGVIDLILVRIDDAPAANLRDGQLHDRPCFDVGQHLSPDTAIALKYAKDRHFPGSSTSSFSFSTAAEIGFIDLDFASQQPSSIIGMSHDSQAKCRYRSQCSSIGDAELKRDLPSRHLELEQFYQSQPISTTERSVIDPAAAEVMKGVSTSTAAPPSVAQSVEFFMPTKGAKSLMVFEAKSQHVFSCRGLGLSDALVSS